MNVYEDESPRMTDYHVVLCPGVRNERIRAFRDRKVALRVSLGNPNEPKDRSGSSDL